MCFGLKSTFINFAIRRIKKLVPKHDIGHALKFRKVLKKGRHAKFDPVEINSNEIAFLQYTGGTTGVSKGAIITHGNMIANVEQVYAWIKAMVVPGKEMVITALPLYHIFSLMVNAFLFMKGGVKNVLITNAKDIAGLTREMAKHKFTVFTGVNTLFKAMMRHKNFKKINFDSLKLSLGGGMSVHKTVAEEWESITNKTLLEGYGLTEASPVVACTPLHWQEYTGSIGYPLPSTEIKLIDDDDNEVPPGEAGELCVRGPQVMAGYWNKPKETSYVLMDGGWLRTGDVVKIDEDGKLFVVDRKKDMIVVSGYNVYPSELESVIAAHPGVLEVAVIGVPSEKTGEFIKAFIVRKDPDLGCSDLMAWCRKQVTSYKIPKRFEFRNDLPKSNVGKILRRALRDEEMAKLK
jgi:long-chain acyl-CoA synthetase